MGEGRPHPDNASASSEDSIKPPPRLDPSRIKPGAGALAADAFDPLKHEEWEQFWYSIDQYFQPINLDHVRFLRSIPVNSYGGLRDFDLRIQKDLPKPELKLERRKEKREPKREKQSSPLREDVKQPPVRAANVKSESSLINARSSPANSISMLPSPPLETDQNALFASFNSFPITHRLIAAMLDENPAGTPAPAAPPARNNRSINSMDDCLWMGIGSEPDVRNYQTALEDRVTLELVETGLLDTNNADYPVEKAMRHEQWKLRDVKTMNRIRKGALYTKIIGNELRQQAITREIKRHYDQVEIAYLERMVRNMKKNKKSRSKFQKLLQRMFGHYKDKDKASEKFKKAADAATNGRLLTSGDDKGRSSVKKKKKKTEHHAQSSNFIANGVPRGGAH